MSAPGALIVGAAGFLGSAIGRKLLEEGFVVSGVSRHGREDAGFPIWTAECTVDVVANFISELRPVVVVHAAGPASVQSSLLDPSADFDGSVLPFQRVLEGIRRTGQHPRVAYLSSASVYGEVETLPIPATTPTRPISPYGHHKVMCETLAREYALCFGIPSLILRIFSVFGAEQRRLLIWELFRKFLSDASVVLDGTGEEARDYIHIDDLAEQVATALTASTTPYFVLNLGSGRSVTTRRLAQLVGRALASDKDVRFTGRRREGDPREWRADMSSYEALCARQLSLDFENRLEEVLLQWRG